MSTGPQFHPAATNPITQRGTMSTPKPLSTAAQAILNAWLSSENGARMLGDPSCLAVALRSLVTYGTPTRGGGIILNGNDLLAIAEELEGANG